MVKERPAPHAFVTSIPTFCLKSHHTDFITLDKDIIFLGSFFKKIISPDVNSLQLKLKKNLHHLKEIAHKTIPFNYPFAEMTFSNFFLLKHLVKSHGRDTGREMPKGRWVKES